MDNTYVIGLHFLSERFLLVITNSEYITVVDLEKKICHGEDYRSNPDLLYLKHYMFTELQPIMNKINSTGRCDLLNLHRKHYSSMSQINDSENVHSRVDSDLKKLYLAINRIEADDYSDMKFYVLEIELDQIYKDMELVYPDWQEDLEIFNRVNPPVVKSQKFSFVDEQANKFGQVRIMCDMTKNCICCITDEGEDDFEDSYEDFLAWDSTV